MISIDGVCISVPGSMRGRLYKMSTSSSLARPDVNVKLASHTFKFHL